MALGALADEDVVASGIGSAFPQGVYAISATLSWGVRGVTPDQGPIAVGIAHSDLSAAEIKESLDSQWSGWPGDDLVAEEQARRPVRSAGQFPFGEEDEVLNEGKPLKTRLRFIVAQGKALQLWAQNKAGASITSGAVIEIQGLFHVRPL